MRPWVPLIALPILFLVACTRSKPVPMQVTLQYVPGVPFEIYSDGKFVNVVVSGDERNRTRSFSAEGSFQNDQLHLPKFMMRLHYPCGWREVPFSLASSWAPEYIRKTVEQHQTLTMNANPPYQSDRSMSIGLDNRGGKVRTLEVGELSYPVEEGRLARLETYQPECSNATIKIDGKEIGSLPAAAKPTDPYAYREPLYVLIDTTATRCYQVRAITYSAYTYLGPGPSVVESLHGKVLYVLEHYPQYALTPAAGSITSQSGVETQYELSEKKCR